MLTVSKEMRNVWWMFNYVYVACVLEGGAICYGVLTLVVK